MKTINFIKKLSDDILYLRFSSALNKLSRMCPNWLFRYNKAWLMYTDRDKFPANTNEHITIKIADKSDIDDIIRISGIQKQKIEYLLDSGVTCFLASLDNQPPAAITWNLVGKCYIRGLGFIHDFGPDGAYGFWSMTLPEARGLGLHAALMAAKAKYAIAHGAPHLYGIIEFDNNLSFAIRVRMGYKIVYEIYYLKLFFLKFSRLKNIPENRATFRIFIKGSYEDTLII